MIHEDGGRRPPRIVPNYAAMAAIYDRLVGRYAFEQWRENFKVMERRYQLDLGLVADVACGTGMAAIYLARRGVEVMAFDRSLEMLRMAAEAARGTGLRLLRQDMRRLSPPEKATTLLCTTDALNHLLREEDVGCTLRSFHGALRPGGYALFDMNTWWQLREGADTEPWHFDFEGLGMTWRSVWHEGEGIATVTVVMRGHGPEGEDLAEIHRERAYDPDWIICELERAGFRAAEVFDAAGMGRVGDRTRRLQFVARR